MSFLSPQCPKAVGKAALIQFNNTDLKGPDLNQPSTAIASDKTEVTFAH